MLRQAADRTPDLVAYRQGLSSGSQEGPLHAAMCPGTRDSGCLAADSSYLPSNIMSPAMASMTTSTYTSTAACWKAIILAMQGSAGEMNTTERFRCLLP